MSSTSPVNGLSNIDPDERHPINIDAVNQMRILGRWMRMITIPNQSSVPKAFAEFDDEGRMKPSPLYLRIVDVCEELVI